MSFELLSSEIVYPGRAFTVRRDNLRLPDGHETKLDIVEHPGSVTIVPMDAGGRVIFVRQYRHAAGRDLLELPAGTLDAGETPESCARREIREETGMAAGKIVLLGAFYLAPGYSTEYMNIYLATDLRPSPLKADADEFLSVEYISLIDAVAMAGRDEIQDAKSLAGLFLVQQHLEKQK